LNGFNFGYAFRTNSGRPEPVDSIKTLKKKKLVELDGVNYFFSLKKTLFI